MLFTPSCPVPSHLFLFAGITGSVQASISHPHRRELLLSSVAWGVRTDLRRRHKTNIKTERYTHTRDNLNRAGRGEGTYGNNPRKQNAKWSSECSEKHSNVCLHPRPHCPPLLHSVKQPCPMKTSENNKTRRQLIQNTLMRAAPSNDFHL